MGRVLHGNAAVHLVTHATAAHRAGLLFERRLCSCRLTLRLHTVQGSGTEATAVCRCKEVLSLGGQQQVDEVVLPDGEEFKSMDVIAKIWDRALQLRLDRKSVRSSSCIWSFSMMCDNAA